MGIGAYGGFDNDAKAVTIDCLNMIEHWEEQGEPDNLIGELIHEDVVGAIWAALPPSFVEADRSHSKDHMALAHNDLLVVEIIGWEHDIGLRVRVRDSLEYWEENLAYQTLERTARGFFDRLSRHLDLRVKTGAFASAPYQPKQAV
ncbi:hypothetical protein [Thiohalorhabdus sp.]|uniref:hypothetical protein n=1 Tax=Thiohalorhabdus sp. TaxID=3094134 RepID=UPI002FC300BA